MRLIVLQEQDDSLPYELTKEQFAELREACKWIEVGLSKQDASKYTLNPGPWVGTIQLPTLTVRIKPKLLDSRVLFLWSYACRPNDWRDEQVPFEEARDLVEAMAHAFVSALDKALRRGALHGYRLTEESAKTVRGRILMREQWANSLRLKSEVAVAYDEFTPDILENRLLKPRSNGSGAFASATSRFVGRSLGTRIKWAMSRITTMPPAEFPKCTSRT